jgi:hypothetical protein
VADVGSEWMCLWLGLEAGGFYLVCMGYPLIFSFLHFSLNFAKIYGPQKFAKLYI